MAGAVRSAAVFFREAIARSYLPQSLRSRNALWKERICFHTSSILDVAGQPVKMPSLSPTMTEGTIVKWMKKEGDTVSAGDVLCEIQTDKAIMALETEEEGVLAKILVPNDTKDVKVGTLIALMVGDGEDWKSVEMPASSNVINPGLIPTPAAAPAAFSGGIVAGQEVKMPSLSPTMTEGTIVKWLKKEGDKVAPGDVLCEIQTDKAVMAFETEEEGILAKILIPNDTKDVKVGTLIAVMVAEGEDWKNVGFPAAATPSQVSPPAQPAFTGGSVPGQPVKMPSLSPTMTEGTILKWMKKEGDRVAPGDVLCEIQTDKAVMSFEIEEEGILAKILVGDDSKDVKVGSVIALMVNEGEDWKDVALPASATVPAADKGSSSPEVLALQPHTYSPHITPYGPAVKTLLEQYQLEDKQITPSGRKGRLFKEDVLQYIKKNNLSPKQPHPVPLPSATFKAKRPAMAAMPDRLLPPPRPRSGYTDIEVSSMRRTIAKRLTESKMLIPHAYCTVECEMDSITALRGQLKRAGIAVSVNDFVIKAVAHALTQCPDINVLYLNDQTVRAAAVDISVAVATPAGLITPIVTNADHKQLDVVSVEVRDLAGRAKLGKLQLHEFQGGSFTISNLGMFGIHEFSAIINPPQCGILAVAGSRPVFRADKRAVSLMTSTLSYDARAIDEVSAAEFLEAFRLAMESPACLLLGVAGSSRAAVKQ